MAGGSTIVSCGNGVRSLEAELASLGIPLDTELQEMETELAVAPIDERLLSEGSLALASAAFRVMGDTVILAAGGLSTPVILQNSGVAAGQGLFIDLLVNTYGTTSGLNQTREPAMAMVGLQSHEDEGFLISPYVQHAKPTLMIEVGKQGLLMSDKKLLGMMTKITDDRAGAVRADGNISKPVTASDQVKLRRGSDRCREIMVKAGANPKSIVVSKVQGAHPGGTAAIGEVVDQNLANKLAG